MFLTLTVLLICIFLPFLGKTSNERIFFALTSVSDFEPQSGLQDNVNNPDQTFDKSPSGYKISKYVERFLYTDCTVRQFLKIS